jgi:hypothetical protein
MKLLHLFLIIHNSEPYFIKNQNKQICANCKFFIPNKNECSKFGTINIITNECNYEKALNVRKDDYKCGEEAIFFKRNYFKCITVPYYFLLEHSFEVLLSSIIILPTLFVCLLMK